MLKNAFNLVAGIGVVAAGAALAKHGVDLIAYLHSGMSDAQAFSPLGFMLGGAFTATGGLLLLNELSTSIDGLMYRNRMDGLDHADTIILKSPEDATLHGLSAKFGKKAFNVAANQLLYGLEYSSEDKCLQKHGKAYRHTNTVTSWMTHASYGFHTSYTYTPPIVAVQVDKNNASKVAPLYPIRDSNKVVRSDGQAFAF